MFNIESKICSVDANAKFSLFYDWYPLLRHDTNQMINYFWTAVRLCAFCFVFSLSSILWLVSLYVPFVSSAFLYRLSSAFWISSNVKLAIKSSKDSFIYNPYIQSPKLFISNKNIEQHVPLRWFWRVIYSAQLMATVELLSIYICSNSGLLFHWTFPY